MGPHLNPLSASLKQRVAGETTTPIPLPAGPAPRTWSAEKDLYAYITERGFFFPREIVSRYLVSLATKPFVLFSGISGTGKTKLALLTAEYFAHSPGTKAFRMETPDDSESSFYLPVDRVTLRSGTLTPKREQYDYFNVEPGSSSTITANITNILGAHGDITFRVHNMVYGGRKFLTISVPVSVRRAFEETGVQEGDYLKFDIAEEFKRFDVSLYRPERQQVEEPPHNRYAFVSVRPSWRDHTALLGEYDDELERYFRTPVLELLLRARREEQEAQRLDRVPAPYFIVLDEMNIAKIEHYFSDFLSGLESRRYDADGSIAQESLNLHNADATRLVWTDEQGVEYEIPQSMPIPTNVLFTGTVNDDESTHSLSPKVLDRANVMEFSAVDFDAFLGIGEDDLADSPLEIPADDTKRLKLGDLTLGNQHETQRLRDRLEPLLLINSVLAPVNMHFGYRVLNDVALFVAHTRRLIGESSEIDEAAIDVQILQKVLPKFFNAHDDHNGVLATVLYFCATGELPPAVPDREAMLAAFDVLATDTGYFRPSAMRATVLPAGDGDAAAPGEEQAVRARYPRSAGKLYRLLSRIE